MGQVPQQGSWTSIVDAVPRDGESGPNGPLIGGLFKGFVPSTTWCGGPDWRVEVTPQLARSWAVPGHSQWHFKHQEVAYPPPIVNFVLSPAMKRCAECGVFSFIFLPTHSYFTWKENEIRQFPRSVSARHWWQLLHLVCGFLKARLLNVFSLSVQQWVTTTLSVLVFVCDMYQDDKSQKLSTASLWHYIQLQTFANVSISATCALFTKQKMKFLTLFGANVKRKVSPVPKYCKFFFSTFFRSAQSVEQ